MQQYSSSHSKMIDATVSSMMRAFDKSFQQAKFHNLIPNLHEAKKIIIASDYGGDHDTAKYKSLSFLFADFDRLGSWEKQRQYIRRTMFTDNRTMSYKKLNDRVRRKALLPFLRAADMIPGVILTLLIDKSVESLFIPTGHIDLEADEFKEFSHWKSGTFEKLLRAIYLVCILLVNFSQPGQDVLWITDEDEIVANEKRLNEAVKIFNTISNRYINHKMGFFAFRTTISDSGSLELEDLASLPDFVAGALTSVMTRYKEESVIPPSQILVPPPNEILWKDREIMNWFSNNSQQLKRLTYLVVEDEESKDLVLHHVGAISANDLRPNLA